MQETAKTILYNDNERQLYTYITVEDVYIQRYEAIDNISNRHIQIEEYLLITTAGFVGNLLRYRVSQFLLAVGCKPI